MTPLCWEGWLTCFQAKGYSCLAPAWPGRDRPVQTLRENPLDSQIGDLTLGDVIRHLTGILEKMDPKPILVGHSMGGLIVQLLISRGLGVAGIAIDSAPPRGVFSASWPFLKSNWPHINPFIPKKEPVRMSFKRFQYAFANTMTLQEQRDAFETHIVPESRRIPAESLTSTASINFKKSGPPLLLIAGGEDHIIPASLNRRNYLKYRRAHSVTDFKEFAGRSHFIIGQNKWEEVADYVHTWLTDKAQVPPAGQKTFNQS